MKNIEKYLKKRNIEVEHILWAHCEKQHNIIIRLDGDEEVRCYMLMQELLKVPYDRQVDHRPVIAEKGFDIQAEAAKLRKLYLK